MRIRYNTMYVCHYQLKKRQLLLLQLLLIYLTLTEAKIFTMKNIYIAVATPLNDKDVMLIKVNEQKIAKKNKIQWLKK